ncbi:antibiotic biosynthesis monooxygenase [Nitrospira sp. T9]|uniref:antibiotic biosynthesis monooxygenase n=1 Tax=unclassified Nitrospira TaxID=2652172 RepID=UPI003F94E8DE
MVLVISRFKVANGLEQDVAKAFQERPRLVETVPGFLGIEVYTPPTDPSIFHLVTRWTDRETFHAWHKSPEHRLSHNMLPQGLKLDPTVTQILELERLPHREDQGEIQDFLGDSILLLEAFLNQTDTIVYCVISPDGRIQVYNDVLLGKLNIPKTEFDTKTIWDFLTTTDQYRLQNVLNIGISNSHERIQLNFIDSAYNPHTFDCLVQKTSSQAIILIGEEPEKFNQRAFVELMQIQNEMTVKMREEVKSANRLSENNSYLNQLVTERTKDLVFHQEQLRSMLVELALVEQRERQHLANELHDYLAQMLIACRLKLAQIGQETIKPAYARVLQEVDGIIDQSLTFTRTLISDLHPAILHQQGLLAALRYLIADMRRFGLTVSSPEVVPSVMVAENISIVVYKTVRELLINVIKHAGVANASIDWECPSEHELLIRVLDSGKGFDPVVSQREQDSGHLGLFFYRERIKALKGHLDIISSPQKGTTITITIPLSP